MSAEPHPELQQNYDHGFLIFQVLYCRLVTPHFKVYIHLNRQRERIVICESVIDCRCFKHGETSNLFNLFRDFSWEERRKECSIGICQLKLSLILASDKYTQ